ncbi:MAG: hypothetical protein M9958_12640 [Chitinophagales bacterium]|nr:hypothetical protein [Chitinophagales bacterium]
MKIRNQSILITISALACLSYFYITPGYLHPAEDASILFNYAQNFKETGVISYYPGGPAVDGSTDFLYLLLISLVMNFIHDAYSAALLVSGISTMLMLFFIFKLLDTKSKGLQYITLFLILFSQQIWAAILGYGTFFFAMMICWVILSYWKGNITTLSWVSALAVISRPDALVTVLPLLLHKIYSEQEKPLKNISKTFLFFGLPLLLYGAFRWWYFGKILPLSFDVNTAGNDKVWGLFPIHSIYHVREYAIYYISPGLIGLLLYIIKSKFKIKSKYYILILSTIILPMLAYLAIRENLDFSRRYFIVPYIGLVIVSALFIRNYKSITLSFFSILLLIRIVMISMEQGSKSLAHYYNNIYNLAQELSKYPEVKLATSEAGIITWKSRLATMDIWGLNTPELTNRLINKQDLKDWNPDLIYIHAAEIDYVYVPDDSLKTVKNWLNMTHVVVNEIVEQDYSTFLVPFDFRAYRDDHFENVGLLKSLLKFISEKRNIKRQPIYRNELFAIHLNSPYRAELKQLIEKFGGKQIYIKK